MALKLQGKSRVRILTESFDSRKFPRDSPILIRRSRQAPISIPTQKYRIESNFALYNGSVVSQGRAIERLPLIKDH